LATGIDPFIVEALFKYSGRDMGFIAKTVHLSPSVFEELVDSIPYVEVVDGKLVIRDRLRLALYFLEKGVSVKRLSRYLDWSDFEKMSAEILGRHGYVVASNVLFTRPRRLEIDVVGVDTGCGRAVVIDCKHWRHGISPSSIIEHGRRHIDRTMKFLRYRSWLYSRYPYFSKVRYAVPVLVTFTTPRLRSVDNRVLVVSISELNNLLQDLHLVLEEMSVKPMSVEEVVRDRIFGD